jgi:hypothetical protein
MFGENIDLLSFSTPLKCLLVKGMVVDISK